jgi:ATP-binding cassette subfamily F protein uup
MPPQLLSLQGLSLTFGGAPLFEAAELFVFERDRVCLVGRNGSGKSTLMKIASGLLEPDAGERFVRPNLTTRYLEQDPDLSGFATTLAYVAAGLGPAGDPHRAVHLLSELGVDPEADPRSLSGGEGRRAAIARALAPEPDVLLLDEPTNHLDLPAIRWLEETLAASRSAIVLISHDRAFLTALSQRTVWIDRGRTRTLDRGFAAFEAWRDQVYDEEEQDAHKLDRKILAEEHWVRYGVTARRKRNMRRMRLLEDMRARRREARRPTGLVAMTAAEGRTSGKLVIEAERVSKALGGRPIVANFSLKVARGDRIGVVGPNGVGKTTLLRLLTGELAPDAGTVKLGTKLQIVGLDQKRASLDLEATVNDTLTEGRGDHVTVGEHKRHVMSYLKDFLFAPEQARSPVSALSGGERGRLALAVALARPSNLLVLDEPTNDLDLETLDLLEEVLSDYAGTVLLVSHDRDFLDRLVASVISTDPSGAPGRWLEYAGGYSDMIAQQKAAGTDPPAMLKTPKTPPKDETTSRPAIERGPPSRRGKLTFNEQHALKTLPDEIERLGVEIAKIEAALADRDLFAKDPARFESLATALTGAQGARAAAEERWLELEIKREGLEG